MNTENTLGKFVPTGKSRMWRNGLNAGPPVMTMPGAITSRGGYTVSLNSYSVKSYLSYLSKKQWNQWQKGTCFIMEVVWKSSYSYYWVSGDKLCVSTTPSTTTSTTTQSTTPPGNNRNNYFS